MSPLPGVSADGFITTGQRYGHHCCPPCSAVCQEMGDGGQWPTADGVCHLPLRWSLVRRILPCYYPSFLISPTECPIRELRIGPVRKFKGCVAPKTLSEVCSATSRNGVWLPSKNSRYDRCSSADVRVAADVYIYIRCSTKKLRLKSTMPWRRPRSPQTLSPRISGLIFTTREANLHP